MLMSLFIINFNIMLCQTLIYLSNSLLVDTFFYYKKPPLTSCICMFANLCYYLLGLNVLEIEFLGKRQCAYLRILIHVVKPPSRKVMPHCQFFVVSIISTLIPYFQSLSHSPPFPFIPLSFHLSPSYNFLNLFQRGQLLCLLLRR